jgi:2-polyprenyl-6-methoxyphenol hydroxylase-like FAD-dependent oxidoreductase
VRATKEEAQEVQIVCVGGGPAGLYFAVLAKLHDPRRRVEVIERDRRGSTYGWGVTFSYDLLAQLFANDPTSAAEILATCIKWRNQEVHVAGRRPVHLGGSCFSIARGDLVRILMRRAEELGVNLRFEQTVSSHCDVPSADLVVASDGANSTLRQLHSAQFRTRRERGINRYLWLATSQTLGSFRYAFEECRGGWIWFYAYPHRNNSTTLVVECPPSAWNRLELGNKGDIETLQLLEQIFARHLNGHGLVARKGPKEEVRWQQFANITNECWVHGNLALLGDAAHTTHYSIGAGTSLAVGDAVTLASELQEKKDDVRAALTAYDRERRPVVAVRQSEARNSAKWFEDMETRSMSSRMQFAFSLSGRAEQELGCRMRPCSSPLQYGIHILTQLRPMRAIRLRLRTHLEIARLRRELDLDQPIYRDIRGH